jgi:carboxymethylenebutenolidase
MPAPSHDGAEKITLDGDVTAYLFRPAVVPTRAIVLFHERYGLVQHTLDLAARFAGDGFVALAPDLFEGKVADCEAVRQGRERATISDEQVVETARAALRRLEGDFEIDESHVAVMGVCQSGRHPICVGHANPAVGAAVIFYGGAQDRDWKVNEMQPVALDEMLNAFHVPLFATFAEGDHVMSIGDMLRFRAELEKGRSSYVIRIQADAPHGFMDSTKPGRYRPEATEESWRAMMAFLDSHLGVTREARAMWEFHGSVAHDYDYSKNVRLE